MSWRESIKKLELLSKRLFGWWKRREEMVKLRVKGHRMETSEFESEPRSILPTPSATVISHVTPRPAPYRGGPASMPDQSMWDL
jgi:hypothetical protein